MASEALNCGVSAFAARDVETAEKSFRSAIALSDEGGSVRVTAQCNLAQLLVQQRRFSEETSEECKIAAEISSGDAATASAMRTNYGTALSLAPQSGDALVAKMAAKREYLRAIEIAGRLPCAAPRLLLAGVCLEMSLDTERFPALESEGRDALTATAAEQIAQVQREIAREGSAASVAPIVIGAVMPLLRLAERCAAQQRVDKTVEILRVCASFDPGSVTSVPLSAASHEAQLYFDAERWEASAAAFDRALALMQTDSRTEHRGGETTTEEDAMAASMHANAATAMAKLARFEESTAHYIRALELFGASAPSSVHFSFGTALMHQKLVRAAAERFEAAAVLDEDNPSYHIASAQALFLLAQEPKKAAAASGAAASGGGASAASSESSERGPFALATAACWHMAEVIRIHPDGIGEEILELDELCTQLRERVEDEGGY